MKILICGLPGSGKTTIAKAIQSQLQESIHLNADMFRCAFNDWDFSNAGRKRQAERMKSAAEVLKSKYEYIIADFVAPTEDLRQIYKSDFTIWMNTIQKGRFEDTNKIFTVPENVDLIITSFDYDTLQIVNKINSIK